MPFREAELASETTMKTNNNTLSSDSPLALSNNNNNNGALTLVTLDRQNQQQHLQPQVVTINYSNNNSSSGYSSEENSNSAISLVVKRTNNNNNNRAEEGRQAVMPSVSLQRKQSDSSSNQQHQPAALAAAEHHEAINPNVTIAKVSNNNQQQGALKVKSFAKLDSISAEELKQKLLAPSVHKFEQTVAALTGEKRRSSFYPAEQARRQSDDSHSLSSVATSGDCGSDGTYACRHCDKTFQNKFHLDSHVVVHTGERNFQCPECDKTFGRRSTLRAHMTTHTGVSNYMCSMCDKACNDNNSLVEHIRMHTGEKPYICSICSKAYARKSHLNVHHRVHTGERPFRCPECTKDFTEKRFLNDHLQTAHDPGVNGPLKCPNCFREFAYKTSLKQHLKKLMCMKNLARGRTGSSSSGGPHPKTFQCKFCDKSYSWKQTLKQHVMTYHSNKAHTDEFWKCELAKHRRNGLSGDTQMNDELWQAQLGKHGPANSSTNEGMEESTPPTTSLDGYDDHRIGDMMDMGKAGSPRDNRWLVEQLTGKANIEHIHVEQELRVLAISPAVVKPAAAEQNNNNNNNNDEGNYPLALLAHVSTEQPKVAKAEVNNQSEQEDSSSPPPTSIADMVQENSMTRTEMWLAQLGKYSQQKPEQDEVHNSNGSSHRSHEELWAEQCARGKPAPSKDPIEITIDDDEDNNNNNNNNNGPEEVRVYQFNNPMISGQQQQLAAAALAPPQLPAVNLQLQSPAVAKRPGGYANLTPTESVLKTILLDRNLRKRPASPPPRPTQPAPASAQLQLPQPLPPMKTDILRQRLLNGCKDDLTSANAVAGSAPAAKPRFSPPSATITSKQAAAAAARPALSAEEDMALKTAAATLVSLHSGVPVKVVSKPPPPRLSLNVSDDSQSSSGPGTPPPQPAADFTKTSVLKHLLHRYNSDNQRDTGV